MFHIHYTFYNRSNFDYDKIFRPEGSGDYLFLHLITPMKVTLHGKTVVTKENAFLLYNKNTPHNYCAVKKFQNSFIHFDTDDASFFEKFQIPTDTILYFSDMEPFVSLLQKIHLEYFLKKPFYENMIDHYISELLILFSRSASNLPVHDPDDTYLFDLFQRARLEILNHHANNWTSESMASLTNLGTSQFYHYYQKFFFTSPKADLIEERMRHAKELLTSQNKMTIAEISVKSGFQNASHFNRFFKKQCGMTPAQYAKLHQNEE